jgi:hypothetical protein
MRALVVVLAAATAGLFVAPPTPACACDCAAVTEAEAMEQADVVFQGLVTRVDEPWAFFSVSSTDPVTVTFAVTEAYKGAVPVDAQVVTVRDGASCGYTFEAGQHYVVYATATDGVWRTGLCVGNQHLAGAEPGRLAGAHEPAPAVGHGPATPWLAVLAGSVVVAIGAAVGLWWWRRSRRSRVTSQA